MSAVTARCVDRFLISRLIFKSAGLYACDSQGPAAPKGLEMHLPGKASFGPALGRGGAPPLPTVCQQQLLFFLQRPGWLSQRTSPAPGPDSGGSTSHQSCSWAGFERGDIKKLLWGATHMTRGAANGPQGWLAVNVRCVEDQYENLQMYVHRKHTSI